jgi:metallo-beta-lactamase class B
MKYIIALILIGLIHYNGFSQNNYKRIKISNDIELIKLSENAYIHVSYSDFPKFGRFPSNGLIFINGNEAFLFDTPATDSLTMDLVSWIRDSLKLKIVGFVPNHWHNDCIGGLVYLKNQRIDSYANQMTIDIAKANNLPVPANGFKDSLQLQLGDKLIKCYYFGAAHSLDNIVVWIPSEQILFPGCLIKSVNSKDLGNIVDGDLIAYPKTIDKLINRFPTAKIVIPGHGQFGGYELIKHTKELSK